MLLLILVTLTATPQGDLTAHAPAKQCEYDHHVFDLGSEAFDQDIKGGWRSLAEQQGCEGKAADVVRYYRQNTYLLCICYIGTKLNFELLSETLRKPSY